MKIKKIYLQYGIIIFAVFLIAYYLNNINNTNNINNNEYKYYFVKPWLAVCNKDFDSTSKLVITCRVWGLLKYYHPNVNKGFVNWDSVLVSSLDKIMNTKTVEDMNCELLWLIRSAGRIKSKDIKKLTSDIPTDSLLNVDPCWIRQSFFNDTIVEYLSRISSLSVEQPSYYIGKKAKNNTPIFTNEKDYSIDYIHDYRYRLLSLFRYWNVIYYFFPYKYQMDTPWDETLYDFIPRFLNANNVENYRLTVRELATRLNDGHAYLDGIHLQYSRIVELVNVNGRIYIRKASSKSVLKRGDIVCKINGKDIYRIRDSIEKYIPSSNIAYTNFKVNRLLGRLIEDANSVTIEREGERHEFTSYIYSYNYFDRQSDNKSYSKLSETIGYVSLDRITESDIPKILEQFKTMNGIILDLRCYPQNYAPYYLLSCFSNKLSFHFYSVLMNDLAHPGAFQMTYPKFTCGYRWYKQEKYHGKLVVLVDESTMSAAECITMMFRAIGSTIIGRPTAGADGNIAKFSLPGNITVNFSSIGIFYPDGSETQRVGILPDIEVQPDVKSVKEGKDEILEAAMEYINEYS